MKNTGMHIWSALNVVLGAMSFLMVLSGIYFWIGAVSAVAALVLGTIGKKSPVKSKQICSVIGIILAVCGAAAFVFGMYSDGYRYIEIL